MDLAVRHLGEEERGLITRFLEVSHLDSQISDVEFQRNSSRWLNRLNLNAQGFGFSVAVASPIHVEYARRLTFATSSRALQG